MSFITKRERVFNEYDLCDLPSRNEGKLKAYASCTDARAWSHFCSDKTEHLVDIIKRNNETCRPKYVPTDVIVRTLMVGKNTEIARLRRKIGEFEQMLSAYDELDLNCEQKCEIAIAHASIKAANNELDNLSLDLDLSGYTEGIDSDAFETGKSRGDELARPIKDYTWSNGPTTASKGEQVKVCTTDAATSAYDSHLNELKEQIITKDAKLNAMSNTIAVLENDICEPYCLYAHIYTALEKIFGILRQNDKYRQYLDLLIAGKDTRCLDIKGKILFKLKVLEKFAIALIAPCSDSIEDECACDQNSTIIARVETALGLTSAEKRKPTQRTNLVADIMGNEDIKELFNQDAASVFQEDDQPICNDYNYNYNINAENLSRLKNLQENYEDLMQCYEDLKYEKDKLQLKCNQYDEQEKELEDLQTQLRNYNMLWNEKEHYRRRSEGIDSLKEQYLVLTDETANLENQLKAEVEMNFSKNNQISELRNQNIHLEKKLNDCIIACEKDKSALQCKLKETECKVMCQEQEIKCLTQQINRLLEQEHTLGPCQQVPLDLMNEVETLKDQIVNLKDALLSSEEDKYQLQNEYENQLRHVNELKIEIMDWKNMYEKTQQSSYFNNYEENDHSKADELLEDENKKLSQTIKEKDLAVENLMNIVANKSREIDNLMEVIETKNDENINLHQKISHIRDKYQSSLDVLETERKDVVNSLSLSRKESEDLLMKVKSYDEIIHKHEDISKLLQDQRNENVDLKNSLDDSMKENEQLLKKLDKLQNKNFTLIQDLQLLQEVNKDALNNINSLQDEKRSLQSSIDITKKESKTMEKKLSQIDVLRSELESFRESCQKLSDEKELLKNDLHNTELELLKTTSSFELTQKESVQLMEKLLDTENLKENFVELSNECKKHKSDNIYLRNELQKNNKELNNTLKSVEALKMEKAQLANDCCARLTDLEQELLKLQNAYDELLSKNTNLQNDFNRKSKELNNLYDLLDDQVNKNLNLKDKFQSLQVQMHKCQKDYETLENENSATKANLNIVEKESKILVDDHIVLENELAKLKELNDQILSEREQLQKHNDILQKQHDATRKENVKVLEQNDNLTMQCEGLEQSLTNTRKQMRSNSRTPEDFYEDIHKEVEKLKKEKMDNQYKIRDLLDRVDESDNYIISLKEEIAARDNRLSVLQNHINNLEEEMRRLHESLEEVVNVGEQIRDHSIQNIDQSLKQMEAHHSRATHNIHMDVATLKNKNIKLEEKLSLTESEKKQSVMDNRKISKQLKKMENERDAILAEIKQFKLNTDSDLNLDSPIDEVISSLENIKREIAAQGSKSSLLEQTLLKMQSSSQLVLSKADEAKRIAEKEKEKIFDEKEEAKKENLKLVKQVAGMEEIKKRLENELSQDKDIINNLEAEILNQKLIIDKINRSRQDYINKLQEEIQTLRKLYEDAISNVATMQKREEKLSCDNDINLNLLEKTKTVLKEKSSEVISLREQIKKLMDKPCNNVSIQCHQSYKDVALQTDSQHNIDHFQSNNKTKHENEYENPKSEFTKTKYYGDNITDSQRKACGANNEFQVLTANIDPFNFEYVRNTYFNYKINKLSPGQLEQHSIGCLVDTINSSINKTSNAENLENNELLLTSTSYPEARRQYTTNFSDTNTMNNEDDSMFFDSVSGKSTDKDFFVIYAEEGNDHDDPDTEEKNQYDTQKVKHHDGDRTELHSKKQNHQRRSKEQKLKMDDSKMLQNDRKKPKLHIDLSRVLTKKTSITTTSTTSLKSFGSNAYLTPKLSQNNSHEYSIYQTGIIKSTPSLPNILSTDTFASTRKRHAYTKRDFYDIKPNNIPAKKANDNNTNKKSKLKDKDSTNNKSNESIKDFQQSRKKSAQQKALRSYSKMLNNKNDIDDDDTHRSEDNFGYKYILDSVHQEISPGISDIYYSSKKPSKSKIELVLIRSDLSLSHENQIHSSATSKETDIKLFVDRGVTVKSDNVEEYENKIHYLKKQLEAGEKDCKRKMEAIKLQYDSNIKSIINEHNQGVNSIQSLHEETLEDFIKLHENEVENLRSMSIEAMRRVEKLQKENRTLKNKYQDYSANPERDEREEEPVKMTSINFKKRRQLRVDTKTLTKTNIEAFNVRPKTRPSGPCTCSLDVNISDTIRNIFQQVDANQRKLAEDSYLKYIANKIINSQVESLDAQELAFLHLKVCRNWKLKLCKEEALQRRIDSLESELLCKQRNAQINIAELDRKVAEERRRLQEVREAVCHTPQRSRETSPDVAFFVHGQPTPPPTAGRNPTCHCNIKVISDLNKRKSAGDLGHAASGLSTGLKPKRVRQENNRASLAKLDVDDRKEKRHLSEEAPTRLRRSQDRYTRCNTKNK